MGERGWSDLIDGTCDGTQILPPFAMATAVADGESVVVRTDTIGFRHVFTASGPGWAAASTSARALAVLTAQGLDIGMIELQSLLGWQAGSGTAFRGVHKMPEGTSVRVESGRLEWPDLTPRSTERFDGSFDEAVAEGADVVRLSVEAALDDHPQLLLQLTGGLDSRILLSAIPQARRARVACLTLAVPGSPDAAMAAQLARRFGMRPQDPVIGRSHEAATCRCPARGAVCGAQS